MSFFDVSSRKLGFFVVAVGLHIVEHLPELVALLSSVMVSFFAVSSLDLGFFVVAVGLHIVEHLPELARLPEVLDDGDLRRQDILCTAADPRLHLEVHVLDLNVHVLDLNCHFLISKSAMLVHASWELGWFSLGQVVLWPVDNMSALIGMVW